jgi:hypothetical protein
VLKSERSTEGVDVKSLGAKGVIIHAKTACAMIYATKDR